MKWDDAAGRLPQHPERAPYDPVEVRTRWEARTGEGGYVAPPNGWWQLLGELADRLDAVWPTWQVAQVKQKFGSLEVYLDTAGLTLAEDVTVGILVDAAKAEAAATCERCGDGDRVTLTTLAVSGRIGRWCAECGDTLVWADLLGDVYSADGVATVLGVDVDAVEADPRLLRLTTANGQTVYPAFQFDEGRLLPGIGEIVATLSVQAATNWTIASWLRSPQPEWEGATPEDLLRDGEVDKVVTAARRFAADLDR